MGFEGHGYNSYKDFHILDLFQTCKAIHIEHFQLIKNKWNKTN